MKKTLIYARGSNLLGQCGLGNKLSNTTEFMPLPQLPFNIKSVISNHASNILLAEDNKTLLYFGFNWDLRSYYRLTALNQSSPFFMKMVKKFWPSLKNFPHTPVILETFKNEISQYDLGGSYVIAKDVNNVIYAIGENMYNQLGTTIDQTLYKFIILHEAANLNIKKISAGFQHSLYLTGDGRIFGTGRSTRNQLGNTENTSEIVIFKELDIQAEKFDGSVIDIATGKYHSLFLTDKGKVYSIGNNKFGQLGKNCLSEFTSPFITEIEFEEDTFITSMCCGDNHNLFLSNKGKVYSNGDNTHGEVNGELSSSIYYQCIPEEVKFLDPNDEVVRIKAKNLRSAAFFKSGKVAYWGGYFFQNKTKISNLPKISGINYYNDEKGLEDKEIIDVGLGYLHDIVIAA